MSAVKSLSVRLAGFKPVVGYLCRSVAVMCSTGPVEIPSKEVRLNDTCGRSTQTCCAKSGVEMMDLEPETLRQ